MLRLSILVGETVFIPENVCIGDYIFKMDFIRKARPGTYTGDVVWLGMHDRRGGEDDADRQMIKVEY